MAYRRRVRRRRTGGMGRFLRTYMINFVWLGIGLAVIGVFAGLGAILPSTTLNLTIGNTNVSVDSRLIYNVIGFGVGGLFAITAVYRLLRVRL